MAIGRVNVKGRSIEDYGIFEIDPKLRKEEVRRGNIFSDIDISKYDYKVYSNYYWQGGSNQYISKHNHSYGREGNIILLEPKEDGKRWKAIKYDYDTGGFKFLKNLNAIHEKDSHIAVETSTDMNRVKIWVGSKLYEETLGTYKTSAPAKGSWLSDNISVAFNKQDAFCYNAQTGDSIGSIIIDPYDRYEANTFACPHLLMGIKENKIIFHVFDDKKGGRVQYREVDIETSANHLYLYDFKNGELISISLFDTTHGQYSVYKLYYGEFDE